MGKETAALLKLGVVFMASAFLTVGAAYAIRIIVLRTDGIAAAGLYQAAWALGGLYVGFILQAMGADFYPRLTADRQQQRGVQPTGQRTGADQHAACRSRVIATLTVAPLVIRLFYTPDFSPAVDSAALDLPWHDAACRRMADGLHRAREGRPPNLVLGRGSRGRRACRPCLAAGPRFGVIGPGVAFFGLYVWHSVLIYLIVRRLSGFRWSTANLKLGMLFLPASGIVFAGFFLLPSWQANVLGAAIVVCSGLYSLRMLLTLLPAEAMPSAMRRLLSLAKRHAS